ncbi:unnamed protein product [Peniophora sp. CBMAI 1063]|nr:unnamed protein product [Peniophora sp. CBMAI 1063]
MKSTTTLASFVALAATVFGSAHHYHQQQVLLHHLARLFTAANAPVPSQATGFQMNAGASVNFQVADTWSGRIWPRTECDFSQPDTTSCATGSCLGGLECSTTGGTDIPPATLAEFTLASSGNDNYDVSLVDGFNVPLQITPSASGCTAPECSANLNPNCPASLQVKDGSGAIVGCKSDCAATNDSAACCTGDHSTPATCPSSGVPDYQYFKGPCPQAYVYAYDDASSLFTCAASSSADYTITFCP